MDTIDGRINFLVEVLERYKNQLEEMDDEEEEEEEEVDIPGSGSGEGVRLSVPSQSDDEREEPHVMEESSPDALQHMISVSISDEDASYDAYIKRLANENYEDSK